MINDAPLQLLMREFFNGFSVVMTLSMALLALVRVGYELHVWTQYRNLADPPVSLRELRRRPVVRVGIGLFVYFAAELVQRAWVFVMLRKTLQHEPDLHEWENLWWVAVSGAGVAIVGSLCILRVLAPEGHGRAASMAAFGFGILFLWATLPAGFAPAVLREMF